MRCLSFLLQLIRRHIVLVGPVTGCIRFDDLVKVVIDSFLHTSLIFFLLNLINNLRGRYLDTIINILFFTKFYTY